MVRVDKLIKYSINTSKISKLIKQIKRIKRASKHKHKSNTKYTNIKTYKAHLKQYEPIKNKQLKPKIKHKLSKETQNPMLDIPNQNPILDITNQNPILDITNQNPILDITNQNPIHKTPVQVNNHNNYIIAIPSYNRPDTIQVKTLAVLYRHRIDPSRITIFVANQDQYNIYKSTIPSFLYNNIEIGVLGLKNQRNFINSFYPEGTHIVELDDDITKIIELVITTRTTTRTTIQQATTPKTTRNIQKPRKTSKPIDDLDGFIKRAFNMCVEKNIFLWGVYPVSNNPYFMTDKITTDLRFIVGPMWGIINRHRPELKLTINEKENSERTLQHFVLDGAVLRFNNIGIETVYYKNKGGMQNEGKNRKTEALKSVYYLHQKYPKITKIVLNKKHKIPEIKMLR